jgi:hypothetical protein
MKITSESEDQLRILKEQQSRKQSFMNELKVIAKETDNRLQEFEEIEERLVIVNVNYIPFLICCRKPLSHA